MTKKAIKQLTPQQRAVLGHAVCAANAMGYFTVQELYAAGAEHLQAMYPCNKNILPTLRIRLQEIRDRCGAVELVHDRGTWRITGTVPCCEDQDCCVRLKSRG